MLYKEDLLESAEKRSQEGMDALNLLADAVLQGVDVKKELPRLVGKIAAALGGLQGMVESVAIQHYPDRPDLVSIQPVPGAETHVRIANAVCGVFRLSLADLIGSSKKQKYVRPRHIFFYLCRLERLPLKLIGKFCGGRDHSTVIYGAEQIEHALSYEDGLPSIIQTIRALLDPNKTPLAIPSTDPE